MASLREPYCVNKGNGIVHLTYETSHRIHTAKVYPIKAPNGSSVVVYGHDSGITLLWHGGQHTKKRRPTQTSSGIEVDLYGSTSSDAVMLIDSDIGKKLSVDLAANSERQQDEELEPSRPYDQIIHKVELHLDTDVLHLAIPSSFSYTSGDLPAFAPAIFSQKVVIAIACSDCTVSVITLPLLPTLASPQSAEVLLLQPRSALGNPAGGIALSWTSSRPSIFAESIDDKNPDLLVATHDFGCPSTLSLFEIEVDATSTLRGLRRQHGKQPETQRLSSGAKSMSFNPCNFICPRNSQLLISESKGAVRIYDHKPSIYRQSYTSLDAISDNGQQYPHQPGGKWLASFFPPLENSSSSSAFPRRKMVLDAQWACNGKCIVVLLGDGEWGLWDVEGLDPKLNGTTELPDSSMNGAAITPFALRGFVGDETINSKLKLQPMRNTIMKQVEGLAPMTPNTRKSKQTDLFSGVKREVTASVPAKGGIAIMPVPVFDNREQDESVLMWYSEKVFKTPNLMRFWRQATSSSQEGHRGVVEARNLIAIPEVATGGEKIIAVAQFAPRPDIKMDYNSFSEISDTDVLVSAEHRLIMILYKGKDLQSRHNHEPFEKMAQNITARNQVSFQIDQDLLSRGDLDLDGVERMLNGLPDAQHAPALSTDSGTRSGGRLGFATNY